MSDTAFFFNTHKKSLSIFLCLFFLAMEKFPRPGNLSRIEVYLIHVSESWKAKDTLLVSV